jgi:NAD-dependent SIR2 family protein deacetylase
MATKLHHWRCEDCLLSTTRTLKESHAATPEIPKNCPRCNGKNIKNMDFTQKTVDTNRKRKDYFI